MEQWVAIDTETTGLSFKKDSLLCVALCYGEKGSALQSYNSNELKCAATHLQRLKDDGAKFIFHNGKFDVKFIKEHLGVSLRIDADTQYAAPLLSERPANNSLDSLTSFFLGVSGWKDDISRKNLRDRDPKQVALYCKTDARYTYRLWEQLKERMREEGILKFYVEKLIPIINLLAEVEYQGICINLLKVKESATKLYEQREILEKKLRVSLEPFVSMYEKKLLMESVSKLKNPGENATPARQLRYATKLAERKANPPKLNLASPKQVLWILKDGLGLHCEDKKGKQSVAEHVLKDMYHEHEAIADLLKLREVEKYISFLEGWEQDAVNSKLFTSYNVDVTKTGRLSSSNPNLQQVPKSDLMRSLFIPEEGRVFIIADYAQIEPRIAACYSKDKTLLNVFRDNLDFYGMIAVQLLNADCHPNEVKEKFPELRKAAKEVGLSILYGIGPYKLAYRIKHATGISYSLEETREIIDNYFQAYPGLVELGKAAVKEYIRHKRLDNLIGRPLYPEDAAAHKVVNMLIQSSASDLCLVSQVKMQEEIKKYELDARLKLIIHDEVVYEVAKKDADKFNEVLKETMTKCKLNVPLVVELRKNNNWGKT